MNAGIVERRARREHEGLSMLYLSTR